MRNKDYDLSEPRMSAGRIAVATGKRIDKYRLVTKLGAGGMGSVYLAYNDDPASVRRPIAIKLMHPHLAEEKRFVEMFLDEGNIAARLDHPFIVRVFDVGRHEDVHFMAMEYLVGESLSSTMKELSDRREKDPTDPLFANHARTAVSVVSDFCEGLHAAHELTGPDGKLEQVVHRDISPQNMFVLYDGTVRLIDFGVARKIGKLHNSTTGVLRGKFAYMAPEQLHAGTVDRRTDVWSLGVILWELLSGKHLFACESQIETALAIDRQRVPLPSELDTTLSDLDPIILRAIERDPDRRYPTARAFGRDLLKYLHKQPEPVDHEEVAAWMTQLFPEGIARQRELMRSLGGVTELPAILSLPPPATHHFETGSEESTTAVDARQPFAAAPRLPRFPLPGDETSTEETTTAVDARRPFSAARRLPRFPLPGDETSTEETTTAVDLRRPFSAAKATRSPRSEHARTVPELPALPLIPKPARPGASSGRMNTALDVRHGDVESREDSVPTAPLVPLHNLAVPARRRSSTSRNIGIMASTALVIALGAKVMPHENGYAVPAAQLGVERPSLEGSPRPQVTPATMSAPVEALTVAARPMTTEPLAASISTPAHDLREASKGIPQIDPTTPVASSQRRDAAGARNEALPHAVPARSRPAQVPASNEPQVVESATTGAVRITSDTEQVDVFFAGRKVGRTPTTVALPVGQQELELRPDGALSTKIAVRVEPNKPVLLSVSPTTH